MRGDGRGRRGRLLVRSGGKLLAALGATGVQNLPAGRRRHAGAKAMPALAHKLAGLIGPLHDRLSNLARKKTQTPGLVARALV